MRKSIKKAKNKNKINRWILLWVIIIIISEQPWWHLNFSELLFQVNDLLIDLFLLFYDCHLRSWVGGVWGISWSKSSGFEGPAWWGVCWWACLPWTNLLDLRGFWDGTPSLILILISPAMIFPTPAMISSDSSSSTLKLTCSKTFNGKWLYDTYITLFVLLTIMWGITSLDQFISTFLANDQVMTTSSFDNYPRLCFLGTGIWFIT